MRKFLILISLVGIVFAVKAQEHTVGAGEIIGRIQKHLTCAWQEVTVDTFKSGNAASQVTGIATTFLANLDVLKRAKAQGLNMVITHEPTFYNHYDDKERYGDDPILKAKLQFIKTNNMVIWRFHDHWHITQPDGIYKGIIDQLGWNQYLRDQNKNLYIIPEISLKALAQMLKAKFNIKTMRVVGNPEMRLKSVAVILGAPGSMAQIALLKRPDVSVLIGGESPEWETVEYVRDAMAAGMDKALIFLGHAISEEPGMAYCADWLKEFITEIPVKFIPAREPFWTPE